MAQLPPKVPSNVANWGAMTSSHSPAWVDDFLHFTTARRGNHRRSVSDSVAFMEVGECGNGFERFDDEQLMSMFSDELAGTGAGVFAGGGPPSSPSDDSRNDDNQKQQPQLPPLKSEPAEEECDIPASATLNFDGNGGGETTFVDPKRVKRILANRQSAQRSRVRKLQYISDLERSVTTLQTEVSTLSPRVAFLDHQRLILNVDNSALKQRIAALAQDKIFKDAHQEALKKEIERLRQIYQQQQEDLKNNHHNHNNNSAINAIPSPSQAHNFACTDKEQLMT